MAEEARESLTYTVARFEELKRVNPRRAGRELAQGLAVLAGYYGVPPERVARVAKRLLAEEREEAPRPVFSRILDGMDDFLERKDGRYLTIDRYSKLHEVKIELGGRPRLLRRLPAEAYRRRAERRVERLVKEELL